MFFDFSVPFMPAFIKMDLSELLALIGAFAMGPVCGTFVCLVKNLLHLTITSTGGVGELTNFILGAAFVKEMLSVIITLVVYKPLSPIIKGKM